MYFVVSRLVLNLWYILVYTINSSFIRCLHHHHLLLIRWFNVEKIDTIWLMRSLEFYSQAECDDFDFGALFILRFFRISNFYSISKMPTIRKFNQKWKKIRLGVFHSDCFLISSLSSFRFGCARDSYVMSEYGTDGFSNIHTKWPMLPKNGKIESGLSIFGWITY